MIDCYKIDSGQPFPEHPNEDDYLVSFDLDEFKASQKLIEQLEKRGVSIPFFEDNRWTVHDVAMGNSVAKQLLSDGNWDSEQEKESIEKWNGVLEILTHQSLDLIWFAD